MFSLTSSILLVIPYNVPSRAPDSRPGAGFPNPGPTIGITVGTSITWRKTGYNFRSYAAPVEDAGAVCVPLGVYAGRDLAKCAGLVVTGGWDIHPDFYDRLPGDENLSAEEVERKYGVNCEARRDELEFDLNERPSSPASPYWASAGGSSPSTWCWHTS